MPSIQTRQAPTYILPEPSKPALTQSQTQAFISIQSLKDQRKRVRKSRIRLFSDPEISNSSSSNTTTTSNTSTNINLTKISLIKEEQPSLPPTPSTLADTQSTISHDIEESMKDWLPIAAGQSSEQSLLEMEAKNYLEKSPPTKPISIIILRKKL